MSIAAVSMSRATAMQYSSAGNAYQTMDAKQSLANNNSEDPNYKDLAEKDSEYDASLQKDNLEYTAGNAMEEQSDELEEEWAESFNVFAE